PISLASPTNYEYLCSGMWYMIHKEVACLMLGRKTVGELHAMLIEYENGLPKKAETPQVMMIKGGKIQKPNKKSLKTKGKGKANGKGKDKQVSIPKPKNPKPSAKERPAKDDTYHHCKEVSHCKRNCLVYLAGLIKKKKKQVATTSSSNVFIILLFSYPTKSWVYDTSCENCHYAPSITRGIVSVHRLVENGFVQHFTDYGISFSKHDVLYFNAIARKGKVTRKSFPHSPERATDLLGIIHTDVCGPLRHVSRQAVGCWFTEGNDGRWLVAAAGGG
nr:hypothetical protein [Tanacetum cinerariifolium]